MVTGNNDSSYRLKCTSLLPVVVSCTAYLPTLRLHFTVKTPGASLLNFYLSSAHTPCFVRSSSTPLCVTCQASGQARDTYLDVVANSCIKVNTPTQIFLKGRPS